MILFANRARKYNSRVSWRVIMNVVVSASIRRVTSVLLLVLCLALGVSGQTKISTTTTLTLTPSSPVAARQIIALTAAITDTNGPVSVGTVDFYDGSFFLGSEQIVRSSAHGYSVGTATLKTAFSIGTHDVLAAYAGTAGISASASGSQAITVTGTGGATVQLSSVTGANNYTFNAAVVANGTAKPSGSAVFTNQTTNVTLGTVALNPANFGLGFSSSVQGPLTAPTTVNTSDLNGDGIPDLICFTFQDARALLASSALGKGDGTFEVGAFSWEAWAIEGPNEYLTIGDFNGDGVPDLAFVGDSPVSVFLGNGDGSFPQTPVSYPVGVSDQLQFLETGDFNGDGILDLIMTDVASNTFFMLLGNSDGTFGSPLSTSSPAGVTSLLVQDFNGDGYADLAVTVGGENSVLILLGNGDGTFRAPVTYSTGNSPILGAVLRSRGSVSTDLSVLNQPDSTLGILLGNGDGTFLPQVTYPVTAQAIQVVATDLTGDGLQDIAVLNSADPTSLTSDGSVTVFPGKGDGTYRPSSQYDAGSVPVALAAADFNSDGMSDLITATFGNYLLDVLLSAEAGTVSLTTPVVGTGIQQVAVAYSGDANYGAVTSNSVAVQGDTGPAPAFVASLNPGTVTIAAGQSVTTTVTITPQNGFQQAVQFACSGLPTNASCAFSPTTVTPNGTAASTTLSIQMSATASGRVVPRYQAGSALLFVVFLFGFGGFIGTTLLPGMHRPAMFSVRRLLFWFALMLVAITLFGCRSGGGTSNNNSSNSTSVTVTASTVVQTNVPSGTATLILVTKN
jgi:FG-GAP-like repeat/Bacterial Ig-like domain (group 3)